MPSLTDVKLFLFLILFQNESIAQTKCASFFMTRVPKTVQDTWSSYSGKTTGYFTADGTYQLLVHGVTTSEVLLEYPNLVSKASFLSISLIDQSKPLTFSNSGLVLNVPPSNILVASSFDMYLRHKDKITVMQAQKKYGIKGPNQILAETKSPIWNEIIVAGTNGNELKPIGFFVVVSADNRPLISLRRLKLIQESSLRNGLPIFYIRNPERVRAHDGIEFD